MKERRLAREVAMQILFQWEAQGLLERHQKELPKNLLNVDIESFISHFWQLFYNKEHTKLDRDFTSYLLRGSLSSLVQIDSLLDNINAKWKLTRMDALERAILRLACFELNSKNLAPAIIINEAVELAKRYGNEQSPQFVNGLLDNIK